MVKPIKDWIVVKPLLREEISKGGIIIPLTVTNKPLKGKVMAVGNGLKGIPMTAKEGDIILYTTHTPKQEIEIKGENYLLMKEYEISAIDNEDR